jgi:hypothetical protein
MVTPHLVDLHDIIQFFFNIPHLGQKFGKLQKEELYNYFCKEDVKINCSCSPLKVPSDYDGL